MRKFGGLVSALTLAAVLSAVAAGSAAARSRGAAGAYDGLWSVYIRTLSGPCDPTYRYPARISGGQILPSVNDFTVLISGNVVASGAIAVSISKGLGTAVGYGRLHGSSGGGRWSANNNTCTGVWSATRRGV